MRNPAHVLVASAALVLLLGVSAPAQDTDPPYIEVTVTDPWAYDVTCDPEGTFPQQQPVVVYLNQLTAAGTVVEFTWEAQDATDPFPDALYLGSSTGAESGDAFPLGDTVLSWRVSDGAGNVQVCTFTVRVTDVANPSAPSPVSWDAGNGEAGTVGDGGVISLQELTLGDGRDIDFTATSTDVCDAAVDVTYAPASGSNFPAGDTVVTVTATDDSGNTSQITFTVSIELPVGALAAPVLTEWYDVDRTGGGYGYYDGGTENEIGWESIDPLADQCVVQCSEDPAFGTLVGEQTIPRPGGGWTEPQSCTFAGLADAGLYYYRVRAEALAGPTYSAWSDVESATQDSEAPVITVAQDPIYFEQMTHAGTIPTGSSLTQTTVSDFSSGSNTPTDVDVVSYEDGAVQLASTSGSATPVTGSVGDMGASYWLGLGIGGAGCGNRYRCDTTSRLTQFGAGLDLGGDQDLTFAVYESTTGGALGSYTRIYSYTATYPGAGGAGPFYSPAGLNIILTAGNYYEFVVLWSGNAAAYYGTVWPEATAFGEGLMGLETAGPPAPATDAFFTENPVFAYRQWMTTEDISTTYEPNGTMEWTVDPGTVDWTTLSFSTIEPTGTDIQVNVSSPGGNANDVTSGDSLANLGVSGSPITITAELSTTNTAITPTLRWWTVEFEAGAAFAGAVSATDTADPDFTPPVSGNSPPWLTTNDIPPGGFNLGTYTIEWIATDHVGNTSTATQTVIVQDGTPPTIGAINWTQAWSHAQANPLPVAGTTNIGATIVIQADTIGGASTSNLTFTGAATDNCDAGTGVTITAPAGVLAVSLPGSPILNEIQCTATDSSGNGVSGILYVEVLDTLAPDTTGVTTVDVEIGQPEHEEGSFPSPWNWTLVSGVFGYWETHGGTGLPLAAPGGVTDICDPDLDDPTPVDHDGYGSTYEIGDQSINWEFIDDSGNRGTVPQVIRIRRLYPRPGGPPH